MGLGDLTPEEVADYGQRIMKRGRRINRIAKFFNLHGDRFTVAAKQDLKTELVALYNEIQGDQP